MTLHGWIALGTLGIATALFLTRRLPFQVTALSIPVVLFATGVLTRVEDALLGFSNPAVVAIGSVMVIGGALRESGVATLVARGLQRVAGRSELAVAALLMVAAAGMSVFINNAAVVAIFLPVAMATARRARVPASRLLMPMAFAAVLGGTVSEIGTAPNLLTADYYAKHVDAQGIGVFGFAPVGLLVALVGVLFLLLIGRRLLPRRAARDGTSASDRGPRDTAEEYGLPQKLFSMRVVPDSAIEGRTLEEAALRTRYGLVVVAIHRAKALGSRWIPAAPDVVIEAEDKLVLVGEEERAWAFCENEHVQFGLASPDTIEQLLRRGTSLAEVTLSPHAEVIGRTLADLRFRSRYDLGVVGFWRRNKVVERDGSHLPLEAGDAFLVAGRPANVRTLAENPDYVVLTDPASVEDVGRAPRALLVLFAALVPPVFLGFPLAMSALGGALLMVLTGCLSPVHVRRVIDWKVLALLVGTLPLGRALQETGVSQLAAQSLGGLAEHGGHLALYAVLFALAMLFATFTSNAASSVIVAPVALAMATHAGASPRHALLAMTYGCSANFLLPFAQCNLLVMTPGGYRPRDYLRVGSLTALVAGCVAVAGLVALSW